MIEREISQGKGLFPTWVECKRWVAVFAVVLLNPVLVSGSAISDTPMEGYVALQVDIESGIVSNLQTITEHIRSTLRRAKIGYVGLGVVEDRIVFEVRKPSQGEEAAQLVKCDWPKVAVSQTDSSFEVFFEQKDLSRIRRDILVQTLNSVRANMLARGVDIDGVRAQGHRCILIPSPAADQLKKFKQNLKSRSKLTIRPIDKSIDPDQGDIPNGFKVLETYKETYGETLSRYVVRRQIFVSGRHIVDASLTMANGQSVMVITLDIVGEQLMLRNLPDTVQQLAIVLDDRVLATAQADRRQPGRVTVHGDRTLEKAQKLATILRAVSTSGIVTIIDTCAE
jgi:preprotein translocase subunit SecD